MEKQANRRIGSSQKQERVTQMDALRDTWRVMKPFVHFSVKALKVIAHALIFIVKHIPKPEGHNTNEKNGKVIKI